MNKTWRYVIILPMEGKIVFQGKTSKNNSIIVRYPKSSDAKAMHEYINTLSKERTFIRFQGEEISFNEETKFLKKQLQKITKNMSVQLLVFSNENLIGISGIEMGEKIDKHNGIFGISIAKDYRKEGIGSLLMKLVIDEAIKNMPQMEIITLGVFGNNHIAKKMYDEFGFREYGNLPNGVKLPDGYVDHIYMYKKIIRE